MSIQEGLARLGSAALEGFVYIEGRSEGLGGLYQGRILRPDWFSDGTTSASSDLIL